MRQPFRNPRRDSRALVITPLSLLLGACLFAGVAGDARAQDVFASGSGLPGQVAGAPCEDTSRYDQQYGIKAVRIRQEEMVSYRGLFQRCAVDKCAPRETAVCWPKLDWRDRVKGVPDTFSTNGLPGKVDGSPCEDTSDSDRSYGVRAVRVQLSKITEYQELFFRCAVDRCAPQETAVCWPKPDWFNLNEVKEGRRVRDDRNDPDSPAYDPAPGVTAPRPTTPRLACTPRLEATIEKNVQAEGLDALHTFAAMGSQADRMIDAFGHATVRALANLASDANATNKAYAQTAQAITDFFASDDPQKYKALFQAMKVALQQAERDPARTLGEVAAEAFINRMTQPGLSCPINSPAAKALTDEAGRVIKAKKRMQAIAKEADDLRREAPPAGVSCASATTVNPRGLRNNCFASAVAHDVNRDRGLNLDERAFNPMRDDVAPSWDQIGQMLQNQYGDRRFLSHTAERAERQALGRLVKMARGDMEQEMLQAGNWARGLVMVKFSNGQNHIFNIENVAGQLHYWDAQGDFNGLSNFLRTNNVTITGDVGFYRTAGRDILP